MPLDKSRIQGFGSDGPGPSGDVGSQRRHGQEADDSIWSSMGLDGPGMQSALDGVALRFGDVVEAATQEITEIATEVKSFALAAVGLDDSDEESREEPEVRQRIQSDAASSQPKSEVGKTISGFCEKYPISRVAPKAAELEQLWAKCKAMTPSAVANALYDQLSYNDGEFEWQPRLRVLYVLAHFYKKGDAGKEIATAVAQQGGGLLQHLVQVHQCKEKASRVVLQLMGKAAALEAGAELPLPPEQEEEPEPAPKPKPKPKPKAKMQEPSLLDMGEPPPTQAPPQQQSGGGGDLDLLAIGPDPFVADSGPADLNLLGTAKASTVDAGGVLDVLGGLSMPSAAASSSKTSFDVGTRGLGAGGLGAGFSPPSRAVDGGRGANVQAAFGLPSAGFAALSSQATPAATGLACLSQAAPFGGLGGMGAMGAMGTAGGSPSLGSTPSNPWGSLQSSSPAGQLTPGPQMPSRGGGWGTSSLQSAPPTGKLAPGPQMPSSAGGGPMMGLGSAANFSWPPVGHQAPAVKAQAKPSPSYTLPAAGELTPLHTTSGQDPFSFVNDLTGLGGAK